MSRRFSNFLEKLHSLQKDKETDWELVFGNLWGYAKNSIRWNEKSNEWEGLVFGEFHFPVMFALSEDEVKRIIQYFEKNKRAGLFFNKSFTFIHF